MSDKNIIPNARDCAWDECCKSYQQHEGRLPKKPDAEKPAPR